MSNDPKPSLEVMTDKPLWMAKCTCQKYPIYSGQNLDTVLSEAHSHLAFYTNSRSPYNNSHGITVEEYSLVLMSKTRPTLERTP